MYSDTYLPYISGAVRSLERLAGGLRDMGHQVSLFVPAYGRQQEEVIPYKARQENGNVVYRVSSIPLYPPANIVLSMPSKRRLEELTKELGVDIIHTHSPATMGRAAAEVGRRLNIPVVFTHHSMYHQYSCFAPKPLKPLIERVVLHWIRDYCRSVSAIIAPSVSVQKEIRRLYNLPSTVISNSIPAVASEGLPWSERLADPLLVYVGRLSLEKNLDLALNAFALVRKVTPARLAFIGAGPMKKTLLAKAHTLKLDKCIIFTGPLSFGQVSEYLHRAALFLFPSFRETQGMVVLEALAHGVPSLTLCTPVNQEIADECEACVMVKPVAEEMAAAIADLLLSPQKLEELSNIGRIYARKYLVENIALETEKFYKSVLSAGKLTGEKQLWYNT